MFVIDNTVPCAGLVAAGTGTFSSMMAPLPPPASSLTVTVSSRTTRLARSDMSWGWRALGSAVADRAWTVTF